MCYARNPDGSVDRAYLDKPGRTDTWFDNLARDEIKREDRRYARAGTPFKGLLSRKDFPASPAAATALHHSAQRLGLDKT